MTLFQWLAGGLMLALSVGELTLQFTQLSRRSISNVRLSCWLVALFLILNPAATGILANLLSIGRGADLILYASVIASVIAFFYVIHALERQREQLTLLVRKIAIADPLAVAKDRCSADPKSEDPPGNTPPQGELQRPMAAGD
jgi:hypothetical protein